MCQSPNKNNNDAKHEQVFDGTEKKGVYMDEALTKTKFGKFNYVLILISGIVMTSVILDSCCISFVLPVSECDLNLTASQKGILGAISFFGIICSSHMWGFLADTKGRRIIIQPTLAIAFVMSLLSTFTSNFYIFTTLRFFNGFFISGSSATIYAYLSEFHDMHNRSRAIMASALIFGISLPLLPIAAFAVINQSWEFYIPIIDIIYKPWRLYIMVCSVPGLLSSIVIFFLPESPKFVLGQGDQAKAIEILERVNRWNNGKHSSLGLVEIYEETESIESRARIQQCKQSRFPLLKSIWIQTAPLFKPPYLSSMLLICAIQFSIFYVSTGFFIFLTGILNKMAENVESYTDDRFYLCDIVNGDYVRNTTEVASNSTDSIMKCNTQLEVATIQVSVVTESLYAVGFAVIRLVINKVGKFPILFTILAVGGAGGIASMFVNIPLAQIGLLVIFSCSGIGGNVVNSATVELFPTAMRAMAVSISLMFGRLGGVAGSNLTAILLDASCENAFYLPGCSLIACAVLAFFIPNIHQKMSKPDLQDDRRSSITSSRV